MWIFTSNGFVSAVAHRTKSNHLMVRARAKEHLAGLAQRVGAQPEHTPDADYEWRVTVSRKVFEGYVLEQIKAIDYDNFKDSIRTSAANSIMGGVEVDADLVGDYHAACSKTWGAMWEFQAMRPSVF
ncbi:MAG: hypothetical protein WCS28_10530 [Thiomicrospira sp.]|jgi:hypothetical protein